MKIARRVVNLFFLKQHTKKENRNYHKGIIYKGDLSREGYHNGEDEEKEDKVGGPMQLWEESTRKLKQFR